MHHGINISGPQYLEDLATGYWYSEVLFTAVELELFNLFEPKGKTASELAEMLDLNPQGLIRFLDALCVIGLLSSHGQHYYNTKVSTEYLVVGKDNYQGDSILWRKYLLAYWQGLAKCLKAGGRVDFVSSQEDSEQRANRIRKYISGMDRVAQTKVREIIPIFEGVSMRGRVLDVGAGSGAIAAGFLKRFPAMTATLMDLPEVLEYTGELILEKEMQERIDFCPANVLEPWPVEKESFHLVILSNIVHAYAENEISGILQKAADSLKPGGYIVIHDFFLEHFPEKAALMDLNMFINTYNGKVFSHKWVRCELSRLKLKDTGFIPLKTDTGLIIASKDNSSLAELNLDPKSLLMSRIKELGFADVCLIAPENVHVTDWADLRCRFGCSNYGRSHCPPGSPTPEKTRNVLKDYSQALLLKGEPPTRNFQRRVLQAEKEAFQAGYYKAFAFWAGPCSLCDCCTEDGLCRNTRDSRPSMEGSGIDVFETVKRAGFTLDTLRAKNEFVTYFGLLLLE